MKGNAMRIFVTGATGFVGSAVVQHLPTSGHEIVGLVQTGVPAVEAAGAEAHRGGLADLQGLGRAVGDADGAIHSAFHHDPSRLGGNREADRRVIEVLGTALTGSDRPLVVASAIGVLTRGQPATGDTKPVPGVNPRVATEEAADSMAARGARVVVARRAPCVHGEGGHAVVPTLTDVAGRPGVSVHGGEGLDRWPAVHPRDATWLFGPALEKGAPGARHQAVSDEGVPLREIAEAIGRGLPCEGRSPEDAAAHRGWSARFADMGVPASILRTRAETGWEPSQPGLIADLDRPSYFGG